MTLWTVLLALCCLFWLLWSGLAVRSIRAVPALEDHAARLERNDDDNEPASQPRVSVIIPARNEADSIEAAVRSRLTDTSADQQIILINDRSDDATETIIDRLAAEDDRIEAVHVRELPGGWLGKVHAMQRGVERARHEWLLLTDADVHVEPGTLAAAVSFAERNQLDHLALLPAIWPSGFAVDAAVTSFARLFVPAARFWAVGRQRSRAAMGVGAFNLVRRSALERTPGFEWLRMEIIDDVALARMIKQHGGRTGICSAFTLLGLYWHRSIGQIARGMEKTATLAAFNSALGLVFAMTALAVWLSPFGAIALAPIQPWLGALGGVSFVATLGSAVMINHWMRRPLLPAMLFPVGDALTLWFFIRAVVLGARRGGVAWRETTYSARQLREGKRMWL